MSGQQEEEVLGSRSKRILDLFNPLRPGAKGRRAKAAADIQRRESTPAAQPPPQPLPPCKSDACLAQDTTNPQRVLSLLRGGRTKDKRNVAVGSWDEEGEVRALETFPMSATIATAGGASLKISVRKLKPASDTAHTPSCFSSCFCAGPSRAKALRYERGGEEVYGTSKIACLAGHKKEIVDLQRSLSGRFLFSGGRDGRCVVWNTETWTKEVQLGRSGVLSAKAAQSEAALFGVAPMRDVENEVCIASEDNRMRVFDIERNKCILKVSDTTAAVSITPGTHNTFFTGGRTGLVKLWDTRVGKEVACIVAHSALVSCVKYDVSEDKLFTSSFDASIRQWDAPSSSPSEPIMTYRGHRGIVRKFETHAGCMYSCSINGTVRVWNIASGENVSTLLLSSWPNVIRILSSEVLAVGHEGNTVTLWRPYTGPGRRVDKPCPASADTLRATNLYNETYVLARAAAPLDTQQKYVYKRVGAAGLKGVRREIEEELHTADIEETKRRTTGVLKRPSVVPEKEEKEKEKEKERTQSVDLLPFGEGSGEQQHRRVSVQFSLAGETNDDNDDVPLCVVMPPSPSRSPEPLEVAVPSPAPSVLSDVSSGDEETPRNRALRAKVLKLQDALLEARAAKRKLSFLMKEQNSELGRCGSSRSLIEEHTRRRSPSNKQAQHRTNEPFGLSVPSSDDEST